MELIIKRKKVPLFFKIFVAVFIIGLPLLVLGILMCDAIMREDESTVEVIGTISKIENPDPNSQQTFPIVYVTYEYNGVTYKDIKTTLLENKGTKDELLKNDIRVGQTIDLMCDKANPGTVVTPSTLITSAIIVLLVGLVLTLIGGVPVFVEIFRYMGYKSLKRRAVKIEAEVDEITRGLLFLPYSLQPYIVFCRYCDSAGKLFRFKSFWTWYNPNLALGAGCKVPVYVNPKNALKYFVDIRGVMRGKAYDLAC